jgi:tRNA-Thr(GGU) m(6)t(6)A37 methyltransferase TsaA
MTATADDVRPGELAAALPGPFDAGLWFIGRLRTPWTRREDCPKHGDRVDGPLCRIELDPRWADALTGLEPDQPLQCLYWMDRARRDLTLQSPRRDGTVIGTFALRSPVRPNPIASSTVTLVRVEGTTVTVRGLDCLDGTPLLDLKPEPRCLL